MLYPGFCGPSNPSQSVIADGERTANFYVERVEASAAPTGAALYPAPGRAAYLSTNKVGGRAMFAVGGRSFGMIGTGFYEWFGTQTATLRGTLAQDSNPATISYNGVAGGQLFITTGNNGYIYDMTTHLVTPIAALAGAATMGGMIDGRFLAFDRLTGAVRMSAINDGLTWNGLAEFFRSAAPDPWVAMVIVNREIRMIGEASSEVWYDAGAPIQPFALIPGSVSEFGTLAPWSAVRSGSSVIWLAQSENGAGRLVRARGYVPEEIGNYALTTAIAGYAREGTIADAETVVYDQEGHVFANVSFPTAGATWTIDLETGALHERGTYSAAHDRYFWPVRAHCYAFNKHLTVDRTTGTVAEMDISFGSEADGSVIRRLRIGPPIWAGSQQRLQVSRFGLIVENGLGLVTGQGSDPTVMFRESVDGKTWSAERQRSAGKIGEFQRGCSWTRCKSSTKLWMPEITVTDPIPWRIAGAEIEGQGFMPPQRAAA